MGVCVCVCGGGGGGEEGRGRGYLNLYWGTPWYKPPYFEAPEVGITKL